MIDDKIGDYLDIEPTTKDYPRLIEDFYSEYGTVIILNNERLFNPRYGLNKKSYEKQNDYDLEGDLW